MGLLVAGSAIPGRAQDQAPTPAEAWLAAQPKEAYDVDALAAKLTTPQEAFAYVRDQIAYEPYTGVMKGAAGALLTHGANDFDRSLLLARLLAAQGVDAKLAYGSLTDRAARDLLDDVLHHSDAASRMLETLPAGSGSEAPESSREKSQDEFLRHQVADRGAEMRMAVAAQNPLLDRLRAQISVRQFDSPRRHVWVQAVVGDKTVDLDPSRSDSKYGEAPAPVEGTWDVGDVPDDQYHVCTIRLIRESLIEGRLARSELLARDLRAVDILGTGFRLVIVPQGSPKTAVDFQPVLLVGDDSTTGETFRLNGLPPAAPASDGGGLFGGLGGAGAPAPAPADVGKAPQLARLWVEVLMHGPGLADETIRRMVVNRVEPEGAGWRLVPALTAVPAVRPLLLQAWDGAVDVGAPHPRVWMQNELAALMAVIPFRDAYKSGKAVDPDDLSPPGLAPQLQGFFLASGLARRQLVAAAAVPMRAFYVRPRLAFLRHGFTVPDWTHPGAPSPRYAEGIDLVNEPARILGPTEAAGALAMQAGIADTELERYVSNHEAPLNTIPFFAAAQAQRVPLVVVTTAAQLGPIGAPSSLRTALEDELALGQVLLVPRELVEFQGQRRLGWWSLDPRTGFAVGKMDLGGAQAMMEYSKGTEVVAKLSRTFGKLMGNMIRCYGGAIGAALGSDESASGPEQADSDEGEEDASVEGQLLDCLSEAACDALKDFATMAKSSFASEKEEGESGVKDMKEVIKELNEMRKEINELNESLESVGGVGESKKGPFNRICEGVLGGGGGE